MTTQQEIENNVKLYNELGAFLGKRVTDPVMARGAVCSLILEATQIAHIINDGDLVGTRDMLVGALNLSLKHGLTQTKP